MRRNDFPYVGSWGVESGPLQSAKMEILANSQFVMLIEVTPCRALALG
jgi:hypothetical protein